MQDQQAGSAQEQTTGGNPLQIEGSSSGRTRQRILLIDDEAFVREAGSAMLDMLGYDCVAVEGGLAAQEYVHKHRHDIDLVMVDLNMPEMDGVECFHGLRDVAPDLRVVIVSGSLHNDPRIRELLAEGLAGVLQKPFTMDVLEKSVKALLSA
jgi:two-component system cell cycle sensor histidine kinase/response regulator CckA